MAEFSVGVNTIEDQHAAIERAFEPLLERMLRGDVSFYPNDGECIPFIHYLSVQNLRTKGVKERLNELNAKAGLPDISRIWSFLALVFAQTTSAGLETQVFQLWFIAVFPEKVSEDDSVAQSKLESAKLAFPGIATLAESDQTEMGRRVLDTARTDAGLAADPRTEPSL